MTEQTKPLPTAHDVFFKANLAEKSKAKALLKQIYSKELVSKLDLKHLKHVPTEFIQHNLRKVVGDVLYMTKLNGKDAYVYVLFEHQSSSDELMAFRLLLYVVQIMQQHLQQGHDKLPIILPAVVYVRCEVAVLLCCMRKQPNVLSLVTYGNMHYWERFCVKLPRQCTRELIGMFVVIQTYQLLASKWLSG
ncbi:Rpn family recombination-promoting nuclease/putative transposase [Cysteiniphilum halobium]|uniref:Rpn family recombination-promoting nuclease/putative transposase n=1 Tax=Cysteiniphilum halobium TaxID=2219059 RepID=UPI003F87DDCE